MAGRDSSSENPARTLSLADTEREPSASADTLMARSPAATPLAAGERVGRYVILSLLGAGGMGAVYAAYDPELDRRIAVKVLAVAPGRAPIDAEARLVREAQALARLSHPNVLPVYDVGLVVDRVFIAMELVEGETLAAWMAKPRRLAEILAVFRAAGLGLAAAHAAGIVHRDFKPHNVLVGADGRVRVADFGLASPSDGDERDTAPVVLLSSDEASQPRFGSPITQTGTVLGTPAYMAPEQRRGEPTDARADQFAFCVALFEALHGVRPFEKLAADAQNAPTADMRHPERTAPRLLTTGRIPGWLHDLLRRGLSQLPQDRFPSMAALLEALGREPAAPRRRVAYAGAALLLVAGSIAASRLLRAEPCGGAARHLAGVWDEPRRADAAAGLRATGAPYADEAWRKIAPRLDRYAADWTAMEEEACRATRVHGDQTETVLDLRLSCLRDRLGALAELGRLLAAADQTVVAHAVSAAGALPAIESCADVEQLRAPIPPPDDPARRAAVEKVRASLAVVTARAAAGHYEEGLALAGPAAAAARATDYGPVIAEALLQLGNCQVLAAHPAEGEATLMAAALAAEVSRHDDIKALAWIRIVEVESTWLSRHHDAHRFAELADSAVRRLGDPPRTRARLLEATAVLSLEEGKPELALDSLRGALAIYERILPADDPTLGELHLDLAEALEALGRYQEALDESDRALAMLERALGPDHPRVAAAIDFGGVALWRLGRVAEAEARERRALALRERVLPPDDPDLAASFHNLSQVLGQLGRYDEATAMMERALAITAKVAGPDSLGVADSLGVLGTLARDRGDLAAARDYLERALAIAERLLGADHPDVATILDNLGNVDFDTGRFAEAIAHQERALAIEEKAFGPDHPKVGLTLTHLAGDYRQVGRLAEAATAGERALAISERALGADHPDLAGPLTTVSDTYLAQHRIAEALPPAERAVALLEQAGLGDSEDAAVARINLANVYLDGGQPARAIPLLERALATTPDDADARELLARAKRGAR